MTSVDEYLDHAKTATRAKSDRELSKLLGVVPGTVSQIRTKRIWPSDDLMVRIAQAANLDPEQALVDLNIWRTSGPARSIYERLAKALAAAAIAGLFILPGQPKTALSAEITPPASGNLSSNSIRYRTFRRLAGQWLRRLRATGLTLHPGIAAIP